MWEFQKDATMTFKRSGGKKLSIEQSQFDDPRNYFWFEALEPGSSVNITKVGSHQIYVSTDGKHTWSLWDGSEIMLENTGDRVWMYDLTDYISNTNVHFRTGQGTLAVGGELMFMCGKREGTMNNNHFSYYFSGMKNLVDASEIIFPDYVSEYCYYNMFYSCTGLKTPPKKLPAITLERNCYCDMFFLCSSLETAPEMDFIYTAYQSCSSMFQSCKALKEPPVFHNVDAQYSSFNGCFNGCSSLEYAPELPATELYGSCYFGMFLDCPNLKTAPETLPATALANDCYNHMFRGCELLENAPALPALDVPKNAYNYMFRDCVNLTGDIILPATHVGEGGYYGMFLNSKITSAEIHATSWDATTGGYGAFRGMFQNCASLSSINVYFPSWPEYDDIAGWVKGVAAEGDFYKFSDLPCSVDDNGIAITGESPSYTGTNKIPVGWRVNSAERDGIEAHT